MLPGCARSPESFVEGVSGLEMPPGGKIISFTDRTFGADCEDLDSRAELEFDGPGFEDLLSQARSLGYDSISTAGALQPDTVDGSGMSRHGYTEAASELSPGGWGLFRYEHGSEDSFTLIVLDPVRRRLVVRAVII